MSDSSSIIDISIRNFILNWSTHNQKMLSELIHLIDLMNKDSTLNKYKTWKEYSLHYGKQFITILSKENRLLYSGVTILLCSLFLYVIDAST